MSRTRPVSRSRAAGTRESAGTPRRRGYQVGHDTRRTIVTVAGRVLVESGYAGLTLKRVADAAGVSVGNLNYHFRTKESLLEALIEHVLTDLSARFDELIQRGTADGSGALGALLQWAMDDSCSRHYTRLTRELWALASHNRSIAAAMDRYYDRSIAAAASRLAGSDDARRLEDLTALVSLICSIAEGASVVFGRRGRRHPQYEAAKRLARAAIENAGSSLIDRAT